MKKRVLLIITAVLLLAALPMMVSARADSEAGLSHITDMAGLLSSSELSQLEAQAEQITNDYNCGLYVIAVDDYNRYSNSRDVYLAAMELYDRYNLGCGSSKVGAVLLLSMDTREYALDFHNADDIFTEAGRDALEDRFVPYLSSGSYAAGFGEFLTCCEEYLLSAKNGTPVGAGQQGYEHEQVYHNGTAPQEKKGFSFLGAIPGAFAAMLTAIGVSAPMKSAKGSGNANAYVETGSFHLTRRVDMFTHRTRTSRPRQTNNQNRPTGGGGGSISHHGGGGHSGRSGHF